MPQKSIRADIQPTVLRWARETAGYNTIEVAERLRINEEVVEKWELGESQPTLRQLEKLADVIYKRPLAAFYLPSPPEELPAPTDFRTLPQKERSPLSPKSLLAIRRARRIQLLSSELSEKLEKEVKPKFMDVSVSDDPENIANEVRKQIRVDLKAQFSWKNHVVAYNEWRKFIENQRILIVQQSVPIDEIRGFSLIEGNVPVIVVNSRDSYSGMIFSLFHELCHIILKVEGICGDMEYSERLDIEKFCNHFAGALLVPKEALLEHELVKGNKQPEWEEEILTELSRVFKVSKDVILRRLLIFGRTIPKFYSEKHDEWELKQRDKKYFRRRGKASTKCVRDNGILFVSFVFEALKKEFITYSDVTDYLSVRAKDIPEIEKIISK